MTFGAVPVDAALGAILAHSLRLPGMRLRKGLVLGESHIAALRAAGHALVTVARLEPGDLHEDAAAHALAAALVDGAPHIRPAAPFTGRVNLIAERAGVVTIDAARIDAANAVEPMITVATVPPCRQVQPGAMAATVKIISYGVAETAVRQAAEVARGAVSLAVPVHATASLIVTEIAGGRGDKGTGAIAARLRALDMDLVETLACAHDEAALARALAAARGEIVLIITASATTDARDTAPEALRRAGGRIERVGMPVDPGNLLFLGALEDKPVIGLPGSARSPVLHGADWVLSRVACGLKVSSADIAAMGVGGLLKEIPSRPQPRRPRRGPDMSKT